MIHRLPMNPWLFVLGQFVLIAGTAYFLSQIRLSMESLLWLIFTSVTWSGLLLVYFITTGVDRAIALLGDIAKKSP